MSTMIVWVLILWTGSTTVVVDNIASQSNCLGLVANYQREASMSGNSAHCLAVRKAVIK